MSDLVARGRPSARKFSPQNQKYAHFRALGDTQAEAARKAGYSVSNAGRLERIPAFREFIEELREKYSNKNLARIETEKAELDHLIQSEKLDRSYFLKELRTNLTLARDAQNVKDANDCLKIMMELLGFMGVKKSNKANDGNIARTPAAVTVVNISDQRNAERPGDGAKNRGTVIDVDGGEDLRRLPDPNDGELVLDLGALDDFIGSSDE